MDDVLSATVRMYRFDNELGDCFLVSFIKGDQASNMLIDCGSFRNGNESKTRLKAIVADIQARLDGRKLDVAVGTHQHNDHVSGFVHCKDEFESIGIEQVWLSWLDDPQDTMAQSIGSEHRNLRDTLGKVRHSLGALGRIDKGARPLEVLDDILGFYGVSASSGPPKIPAEAIKNLKSLARKKVQYLKPGVVLDVPGLPKDSARVYVLGPPRDRELLRRVRPREGESYDHALANASISANRLLSAALAQTGQVGSEEAQYPFSEQVKKKDSGSTALNQLRERYSDTQDRWRTIDDDWLGQVEGLALFLDSYTNNSSLVFAIELVESKKVLMFAADAQTGNWTSWFDVAWARADTRTDDLLARTVLYKVGHHGSHNATLPAALEKMTNPDLIALIPVHKKDANIAKDNGWKMPARNLLRQLAQSCSNRVLQMDGKHTGGCSPAANAQAWRSAGVIPKQTELFFEVTINDI